MEMKDRVAQLVENKRDLFIQASDDIWGYAETRFEEYKSAQLLSEILEHEGFTVEREAGGLETGFIGSYGSGHPVIAILGEFDALSGLSQVAGEAAYQPLIPEGNGHGCGHNLLGTGALAAAVAVKDYMQESGMSGTVRYYGCPAEESGSGKAFMAKAGLFNDVDAAFSWHPGTANSVWHMSSLANINVTFRFKGQSAHAGAAPHLGRSALDAVELMNVGTNYMREHMIDLARVHYAVTNTGGKSPNVVQAEAEVVYLIRAPKSKQVTELFERIKNIAQGAALMTGTQVEHVVEGATSNLIPNATLEKRMHQNLLDLGLPEYTAEEKVLAKAIYETIPEIDKADAAMMAGKALAARLAEQPLAEFVKPYHEQMVIMTGSTDVGDVSWIVPTAQCSTATWAYATPIHAWQVVAQGKSTYAHKGMLLAGKTMALSALQALLSPELIAEAKAEHAERLDGEAYICPIPAEIYPPKLSSAAKLPVSI
ncbi:M20 family metallopeptidase [Paenibacillus ihuae]|uniref:M20 family metallopeptidase n=1 Tax=Paenibacillus ihuae TaxID=1232431 RepID=UPI0006D55115|nr:M20 family metallopeptidase [Paenibacillus ihuae]